MSCPIQSCPGTLGLSASNCDCTGYYKNYLCSGNTEYTFSQIQPGDTVDFNICGSNTAYGDQYTTYYIGPSYPEMDFMETVTESNCNSNNDYDFCDPYNAEDPIYQNGFGISGTCRYNNTQFINGNHISFISSIITPSALGNETCTDGDGSEVSNYITITNSVTNMINYPLNVCMKAYTPSSNCYASYDFSNTISPSPTPSPIPSTPYPTKYPTYSSYNNDDNNDDNDDNNDDSTDDEIDYGDNCKIIVESGTFCDGTQYSCYDLTSCPSASCTSSQYYSKYSNINGNICSYSKSCCTNYYISSSTTPSPTYISSDSPLPYYPPSSSPTSNTSSGNGGLIAGIVFVVLFVVFCVVAIPYYFLYMKKDNNAPTQQNVEMYSTNNPVLSNGGQHDEENDRL